MERDFMGLSTVKQEISEESSTDPAVARSSAMQWSFSNKAHPQNHLSNHHDHNNNNSNIKPKVGFESLASAGLVTITTTNEVVDTIHRPYSTQIIGSHQSHEVRSLLPIANRQANLMISTVNLNPARGSQITSPSSAHHVATRNGVVGTTELRGAPKTSSGPAQLTIFYAGSVCVYDNISPEKAQAIMLLAGNAPPVTPSTTSTASPIQTISNSPSLDAFVSVNKCHGTSPSNLSGCPISITSRKSIGVFSHNTNDTTIIRSIGVLKSPSNTPELHKIVTSQESRPPSHNLSAIPQARKASLARFLEKRKERVVSASPYGNSKQSSKDMTTPGSNNWSFSINSSVSTPLLPATN